jgi:hypothetical protein
MAGARNIQPIETRLTLEEDEGARQEWTALAFERNVSYLAITPFTDLHSSKRRSKNRPRHAVRVSP